MKPTRITDRLTFLEPEVMRSFLAMRDSVTRQHHREMIARGGLGRFFPESHAVGKESA